MWWKILLCETFNAKSSLQLYRFYLTTVTNAITITKTLNILIFIVWLSVLFHYPFFAKKKKRLSYSFFASTEPFRSTAKMQMNFEQFWCEAIRYNWKIILMCVSLFSIPLAFSVLCTFCNSMSKLGGGRSWKVQVMAYEGGLYRGEKGKKKTSKPGLRSARFLPLSAREPSKTIFYLDRIHQPSSLGIVRKKPMLPVWLGWWAHTRKLMVARNARLMTAVLSRSWKDTELTFVP